MARLILCIILIFSLTSCKRNWRNVVIEKRLYNNGYYLHIPDKKYSVPKDYVPPVPYPVARTNEKVTEPIYTAVSPDTLKSDYPQPYFPSNYSPVYTYTYTPVPAPVNNSTPVYGSGIGNINFKDSVPPVFAIGKIVHSDSAVNQTIMERMNDTITHLVQNDTLLIDTADVVTIYGEQKHCRHLDISSSGFLQLGMINGPQSEGIPVNFYSFSFAAGVRFKTKMNKWNAIVFDMGYRLNQFYIGQNDTKVFPLSSASHNRERISVNDFSGSICNRIIFKRGDEKPPYYLDMGMYGNASFRTSNVYVDKVLDSNSPIADKSKVTTKNVHLNFLEKWNYGATVRFGFKRYSCFAMWRLSDMVKHDSSENHSDLPRLVIGVEMNFGEEFDY